MDVSIPTTYKIADIREPDKRDADTTLTIEIPSTKEIDEIFEFCFEVNLSLQNFNPNLKTDVEYYINNSRVLQGSLQLNKIMVMPLTNEVIYYCNIKGQLTDLFYSIGEKYLIGNDNPAHDLDFSEYDHVLNKTNYLNTWDPAVSPNTNKVSGVDTTIVAGQGYRYPLIDYGLNAGNTTDFYVHHQRPALFLREYLDKIFTLAGKTWTSTFLDGTFFKRKVVPCTEIITRPQADIDNNECYVGWATSTLVATDGLSYSGSAWTDAGFSINLKPNTDNTPPYSDAGNIYATVNGELVIPQDNDYKVSAKMALGVTFNSSAFPGDYYISSFDATISLILVKNAVSVSTSAYSITGTSANGGTSHVFQNLFYVENEGSFATGDVFKIDISYQVTNVIIRKISDNSLIITGTADYQMGVEGLIPFDPISIQPYFTCQLTDTNIYEGDTLEVNQTIPRKIKQKDLLKATINAFNLYILPDKTNPNNYFIEPRNTFYSATYVDWTDKLDVTKGIEILPMGELDAKQFKYKYKQGGDFYNKSYQDSWQEIYGEVTFEAENEFVNGDKTTELIFSPTPLIGNTTNDLIIPRIFKNEEGIITFTKDNIRLLDYDGAISNNLAWSLYTVAGFDSNWFTYPYAGHLDNPNTPTFDLSFGVPEYVYFETTSYPTANLFTEYHYDFIYAITNKNSKIITAYFYLDELDIETFDFRKQVFVNGAYYLVNAIIDFDVLDFKTTKVELLKLA